MKGNSQEQHNTLRARFWRNNSRKTQSPHLHPRSSFGPDHVEEANDVGLRTVEDDRVVLLSNPASRDYDHHGGALSHSSRGG